jgi:L,D-transpeptidase ErfK/SrfK
MNIFSSSFQNKLFAPRLAASFLTALIISGCSVIQAPTTDDDNEVVVKAEQSPLGSNRFVLEADQDVVGEVQTMKAKYEDTFVDVARAYGLGFDELVAANPGIDPWLPGDGAIIVLPTRFVLPEAPREGLVLNIAAKRLFYYSETEPGEQAIVETYPIGIGRSGWSTPTGDTLIVSKARDPVWFVPASVRKEHREAGDPLPRQVPPGPDNPLGAYVLGLGIPGYLIHGTNKPAGVGMRISHGCVRLFPEDIEYLYEQVGIGARVRLVNQPFLFGGQNGDLVFEAHEPLLEDERDWHGNVLMHARSSLVNYAGDRTQLDEARVMKIAEERRGFPVSVFTGGPDTAGVVRNARPVFNIVSGESAAERIADENVSQ